MIQIEGGEMAQVNLGTVEVLAKDAVSLKDIDPDNIPAFMDVIVTPRKKEIILLGRQVDEEDLDEDGGSAVGQENTSVDTAYVHQVQKHMFHEKSHEEFRDETTYFFDPEFRVISPLDYLSTILRSLPLAVIIISLMLSWNEDRESRVNAELLEEQELKEIDRLRRLQQKRIALESIDRKQKELIGMEYKYD